MELITVTRDTPMASYPFLCRDTKQHTTVNQQYFRLPKGLRFVNSEFEKPGFDHLTYFGRWWTCARLSPDLKKYPGWLTKLQRMSDNLVDVIIIADLCFISIPYGNVHPKYTGSYNFGTADSNYKIKNGKTTQEGVYSILNEPHIVAMDRSYYNILARRELTYFGAGKDWEEFFNKFKDDAIWILEHGASKYIYKTHPAIDNFSFIEKNVPALYSLLTDDYKYMVSIKDMYSNISNLSALRSLETIIKKLYPNAQYDSFAEFIEALEPCMEEADCTDDTDNSEETD